MLIKILKGKLIILLLILISAVVMSYQLAWYNLHTESCLAADILYLIPADESKIEEQAKPDKLLAHQQARSVGVVSDWICVKQLANEGITKAVIIHHAATDQVNQEELAFLFQQKRFVVAGIGIPGKQLAEMVGMPGLESRPHVYKTSVYFYIYSFWAEGTPEEIKRIAASKNIEEAIGTGGVSRTTDSLLANDVDVLLKLIEEQIWSINNPYYAPPRPTIEGLEELLKERSKN